MWSILNGTIINVITVIVGSVAGLSIARKVPERYQQIMLSCLGLITITLGVDAGVLTFAETVKTFAPQVENSATYGARLAMAMIASLIVGSLLGTALKLHERIEGVGRWIHQRFSTGDAHSFSKGFLTASVIFCVGPLTLLGCLENGARGDPSYLYIKSCLDGFCSLALASTLGAGVLASIVTILLFQGSLSLLAYWISDPLDEVSLALMTIVGGVILLGTALMILDIKRIPVANMLPGLFLAPLFIWLAELIKPGLLLPLP